MVAISAILFLGISQFSKQPPSANIEKTVYAPSLLKPEKEATAWYLDYRVHAILLVLLMTYILILFW